MATSIPVMTSQPVRHGKEGEARAAARRATAAEAKKSGVRVDQSQCKELGGIVYQAIPVSSRPTAPISSDVFGVKTSGIVPRTLLDVFLPRCSS
jgi:hypothetical protein